jgi:uncharacterized membrane protein YoaK (UPF0700 family)
MPIQYLRTLTRRERTQAANERLAGYLALVAGAANAGGYLAVRQYTSHMSGIVSAMADNVALHDLGLVLSGGGALVSFLAGAACTAVMVNWGRRRRLEGVYALPLMLEAGLLVVFGLTGGHLREHHWLFVPATVCLLCFTMGLQNAIITKISHAEIRTTHVTGMVTDIGIELGKWIYWSRMEGAPPVKPNWTKLKLLSSLVGLFFSGGVIGALGFKHLGFSSALPLAAGLVVLAAVPLVDDLRGLRRRHHPL